MTDLTHINTVDHPLDDNAYRDSCKSQCDEHGMLIVRQFLTLDGVDAVLAECLEREDQAFFTSDTHNVYLTPPDPALGTDHIFNRQIASTKGCLADDQVAVHSPLRLIYNDPTFRAFLCAVLDVAEVHPYADNVSSINVHFHQDGQELGWHFDNSEFAVTLLLQAPERGGVFEYVPGVRVADASEFNFTGVEAVVDGRTEVMQATIEPGDLVLFRGRNSMHRVTPSRGDQTRVLVVFAYNTEPGIGLSDQAKETFYGRLT